MKIERDKNHVYTVDGRVMPSVHEILHSNGFIDDRWYNDEGKVRGQLVALVTEMWDSKTLDVNQLDVQAQLHDLDLVGYLNSWRTFRKEWPFYIHAAEVPVYHPLYGYCGTPDRVIEREGKIAVLEIKTGGKEAWHAIQTVAYALTCPTFARRFAVYLTADKPGQLVEHMDSTDEPTWLGALQIFKWKESHGIATA